MILISFSNIISITIGFFPSFKIYATPILKPLTTPYPPFEMNKFMCCINPPPKKSFFFKSQHTVSSFSDSVFLISGLVFFQIVYHYSYRYLLVFLVVFSIQFWGIFSIVIRNVNKMLKMLTKC